MKDPFTISYDLRKVGTFQLSDIFYNTVGGAVGGLMYLLCGNENKKDI